MIWIFPKKIDVVKRKILPFVITTHKDKDTPALSVFFADCRRPR